MENLNRIAGIVHGSYAKKEEIIDILCSKCIIDQSELLPDLWKICDREQRPGDKQKRFYVHDTVLRGLGVGFNKSVVIAQDKNHATPKLDNPNSYRFWIHDKNKPQTVKKSLTKLGAESSKGSKYKAPKTVKKKDLPKPVVIEEEEEPSEYEI